MKKIISKIIFEELSYIYCTNCRFADENYDYTQEDFNSDPCEDCYRKMMNWEISEQFSDELADKIIKAIERK